MAKNNQNKGGLTDKELIEKYGDQKSSGFNEALKKIVQTDKKKVSPHTTKSPLSSPTKKK